MQIKRIGQAIRITRKVKNIKSKDFAKEIKKSASYVRAIESGKEFPSYKVSIKICKILNWQTNSFLTELKKEKIIQQLNRYVDKIKNIYTTKNNLCIEIYIQGEK